MQKEILLPEKIKKISGEGSTATFEIDKLYPGYGHTLGNSLRRIILSSIPGVAITKVSIKDVIHEFSTIVGVKEDTINLVLNLKKIVFKIENNDEIIISFKIKKIGKIFAKDIKLPTQVEIMNPDEYLFTLEKNKEIEIDLEIMKGLAYVSKEEIKTGKKNKPGEIVMDASFTPVRRVSYEVLNTRVGDRTDFNKLSIFIETDGSITPEQVIEDSIRIMISQLRAIIVGEEKKIVKDKISEDEKSIATLNLSGEIMEKIAASGVIKILELKEMDDRSILDIEGISADDLEEIKKSLE